MEKLHSYQGWGGRVHEWRDQIRERYANWREEHPETVIELIKKGARPSRSSDEYSHIYRSLFSSNPKLNLYFTYSNVRIVIVCLSANRRCDWNDNEFILCIQIVCNCDFYCSDFYFIDAFPPVKGQRLAWNWWKCQRLWWVLNFRMLLKLHSYHRHYWALAYNISTWRWSGHCRHWWDFFSRQFWVRWAIDVDWILADVDRLSFYCRLEYLLVSIVMLVF